jgi:GAF domain-containing protein
MTRIDATALGLSLARLEDVHRRDLDPQDMLKQVVAAVDQLFGLSGAGLMLVDDGQVLRYAAASDETSAQLEISQEELGEGPCIDSFVHDHAVEVRDLASDERYQRLAQRLADVPIDAVLGVPVNISGSSVGSLNVYLDRPHDWQPEEVGALEGYARVVEMVLVTVLTARRHSRLAEQLQYALDYRVVIERGVGYLMARYEVDEVQAFHVLRRTARSSRRKVGEVARDIIAGKPIEDAAIASS